MFLVCSNVYEESTGLIRSPGYPQNYPHETFCNYLIKALPGNAIVLKFLDFDIEGLHPVWNCPFDYLEVSEQQNYMLPMYITI